MPHVPVSDLIEESVICLLHDALGDLKSDPFDPLGQIIYSGRAPAGAPIPYAIYGDGGEARGQAFGPSAAGDDTITLIAAGPGYRGAKRFYARAATALNAATLTLGNGALARGRLEMISVAEDAGDPTGLIVRLITRFSWYMVSAPTTVAP